MNISQDKIYEIGTKLSEKAAQANHTTVDNTGKLIDMIGEQVRAIVAKVMSKTR